MSDNIETQITELREAIAQKDYVRVEAICDEMKADNGPYIVQVSHDDSPEDPCAQDGWQLHSFSTKHHNHRDPNSFDDDEVQELQDKGLAFPLSYFEHGQCIWSLRGTGPQCRWDNVSFAGLLIWEGDEDDIGAKTVEDRSADAARFLETYTKWCNGEVYGYEVVNGDDGCWGFYDADYMFGLIREAVGDRAVKFVGDATYLAKHLWKEEKETV